MSIQHGARWMRVGVDGNFYFLCCAMRFYLHDKFSSREFDDFNGACRKDCVKSPCWCYQIIQVRFVVMIVPANWDPNIDSDTLSPEPEREKAMFLKWSLIFNAPWSQQNAHTKAYGIKSPLPSPHNNFVWYVLWWKSILTFITIAFLAFFVLILIYWALRRDNGA